MKEPPKVAIEVALAAAKQSPCGKSKRGVSVYRVRSTDGDAIVVGLGWNGMPGGAACTNDETCRRLCAQRCVHAEMRAIRGAAIRHLVPLTSHDAVHVKIGAAGELVPSGGPSCWQCSREILDVGLGGFWLYHGDCLEPWRRYTAAEFHASTLINCGLS